jgi:hypothetical protein
MRCYAIQIRFDRVTRNSRKRPGLRARNSYAPEPGMRLSAQKQRILRHQRSSRPVFQGTSDSGKAAERPLMKPAQGRLSGGTVQSKKARLNDI